MNTHYWIIYNDEWPLMSSDSFVMQGEDHVGSPREAQVTGQMAHKRIITITKRTTSLYPCPTLGRRNRAQNTQKNLHVQGARTQDSTIRYKAIQSVQQLHQTTYQFERIPDTSYDSIILYPQWLGMWVIDKYGKTTIKQWNRYYKIKTWAIPIVPSSVQFHTRPMLDSKTLGPNRWKAPLTADHTCDQRGWRSTRDHVPSQFLLSQRFWKFAADFARQTY